MFQVATLLSLLRSNALMTQGLFPLQGSLERTLKEEIFTFYQLFLWLLIKFLKPDCEFSLQILAIEKHSLNGHTAFSLL